MRVSRRLGAGFALLLSACTVGPDFEKPSVTDIPAWRDSSATGATMAVYSDPDPKWWGTFNDPVLDALIKKAIAGNLDVQQAVLRVVESRQSVVAAQAAGLPSLGANASYMREQFGAKGILESQGVYRDLNNLADRLQPLDSVAPGLSQGVAAGANQALNRPCHISGFY
jgi:outer membrane protein, multidrug efflux system